MFVRRTASRTRSTRVPAGRVFDAPLPPPHGSRAGTPKDISRRSRTSTRPRTTPCASGRQRKFETVDTIYPNVFDRVDRMNFIERCVESSKQGGTWVSLKHAACRK